MIDKENRAHDYAKILLASNHSFDGSEHLAREAWELVDAMQVEADKRKVVGVPDAVRENSYTSGCKIPERPFFKGK